MPKGQDRNSLISRDRSALLVVDVQEKLAPAIDGIAAVLENIGAMIEGAAALDVPVVFTEQYSRGLGATVGELRRLAPGAPVLEKTYFCAAAEPGLLDQVRALDRRQLVVAGTEAHVCVLQTTLGLIQAGFDIFLVRNAVASRYPGDRDCAVERLRTAGAVPVSAEMVLFEWLEKADTEAFRRVLPIVKRLGVPARPGQLRSI
jgi:nicotinamidase-related amidase